MLVGLQTADHRRLAAPVQEAQGPPAPGDRTRIVRFPVGKQGEVVAQRFAPCRGRRCSALLPPSLSSLTRRERPHGRTSEVFLS